ncbi:AMP-binding protein [Aeromicrobium sp. 636]|uniref:AMP-binding protein n=1 Tax=Aeromicrobium senzhongii TaxID=2663859 RepID=A0A8I0EXV6_9ACTN|nr:MULTISPECIES: AMP-binding protein [Aeromicrobium]MBC9227447.1 AMP-binding protein [Aeromicrobium senzhongii]MCQ3999544.1 AMP-binding protein [Aeromicrobium sp. 636]
MNTVDRLWSHAENTPDAIAVRVADESWTYGRLRDLIATWAARLDRAGISAGDRVLLVAPTSQEFVVVHHAVAAIGAIGVTVNSTSTAAELEYFLTDAECALAIAWHETQDVARRAAEATGIDLWVLEAGDVEIDVSPDLQLPRPMAEDDTSVLLYTSGTTGKPKGAELTHGNIVACAEIIAGALESDSSDRVGTALPLFHVFGQVCVMASTFAVGASLSLLRPFSGPGLLQMAAAHRLTVLAGVPTMWNAMLHADVDVSREDLAGLTHALSGGAALPLAVADAFRERFGCRVLDGYGLSETTGAATSAKLSVRRKEGSVGPALPRLKACIMDPDGRQVEPGVHGEVAVAGPVIMKGYWRRPEATAEVMRGEWFLTGDIGKQDEDGDVWIVDRKKDLVIRGGYNVYPREIEEVLYTHPDLREVAVIGVPDDRLGEEIAVVFAPHPGREVDAARLREWLEERVAPYKVPRVYQQVEELPKGSTGKILKRQLDRGAVLAEGTRVSSGRSAS